MSEIDPTQAANGDGAGHAGKREREKQAAAHPELATDCHSMVSELVVVLTGWASTPREPEPLAG